jgi:sigma-B regulation protein RsbU (phosphoserine phosphatase)
VNNGYGMRILIAEDERISRKILEHALTALNYDVEVVADGDAAWKALCSEDPPSLAILDWIMPGLDGTEICQRIRQRFQPVPTYIILLTSRSRQEDIVAGLRAGADDYLTKPFDPDELRARVQVGTRLIDLQLRLKAQVDELARALAHVKQLRGLLPICAWCKKIRNDSNYWEQLEVYIADHTEAQFSHGICPTCYAEQRPKRD